MRYKHPDKWGRCKECKKEAKLIYFKKKYRCEECLNPHIEIDAEEVTPSPTCALDDAEVFAPGKVGIPRDKIVREFREKEEAQREFMLNELKRLSLGPE